MHSSDQVPSTSPTPPPIQQLIIIIIIKYIIISTMDGVVTGHAPGH